MALLLKEYKRKRFQLLLLCLFFLFFLCLNLIEPYAKTILFLEHYYPIFPAVLCCLILSDNEEVELLITYTSRKTLLFFTRYFSIVSFTVIGAAGVWLSFHTQYRALISLSFCVTSLFISSLAILLRLALQSAYGSLAFLIISCLMFHFISGAIGEQDLPVWRAFFDPYITSYMIGTKVWAINRMLFFSITLVIWLICFLLLKQEKLFNR